MTHKASAILFDVLKSLFLFIYFFPVLFLCTKPWGGFLVPLISTRHRLIKTSSTQWVGGASVLFAQFNYFITNFRSFSTFHRVCGSFINNKHNPSLMYVGLDQSQRSGRWVGRCRVVQLARIRQMIGQVSGGSPIEYEADEQAGVARSAFEYAV